MANKAWQSGHCSAETPAPATGQTCEEDEGVKYVYDWEDLIANEKTDSLDQCLNLCQVRPLKRIEIL